MTRPGTRKTALMVIKASTRIVPCTTNIDCKIGSLNQRLIARTNQAVLRENAHQDPHTKYVVGVKAATVRGDGFLLCHEWRAV
jgi:hypothetical protein